jgi:glucan phosphorylase
VSGGSSVFSEPESTALKNYVAKSSPVAVVVWYSSAGGVFASNCHNGVSNETNAITKKYADASLYKAYQEFNFYKITGDMVNWLAKINIPAISVLLTNHTDTEWTKNQKGVEALLKHYAK